MSFTKSDLAKRRIIESCKKAISESDGHVSKVTIRDIASLSSLSVGMVNHYFNSKDELIQICLGEILLTEIDSLTIPENSNLSPEFLVFSLLEKMMTFYLDNPELVTISLNYELTLPQETDATTSLIKKINIVIKDFQLSSWLIYSLQMSFLRRRILLSQNNLDLQNPSQRKEYLQSLVKTLIVQENKRAA
ncbi:MAG: TetR/AcrR family transcriptional regulator [Bacilli bacterium]